MPKTKTKRNCVMISQNPGQEVVGEHTDGVARLYSSVKEQGRDPAVIVWMRHTGKKPLFTTFAHAKAYGHDKQCTGPRCTGNDQKCYNNRARNVCHPVFV